MSGASCSSCGCVARKQFASSASKGANNAEADSSARVGSSKRRSPDQLSSHSSSPQQQPTKQQRRYLTLSACRAAAEVFKQALQNLWALIMLRRLLPLLHQPAQVTLLPASNPQPSRNSRSQSRPQHHLLPQPAPMARRHSVGAGNSSARWTCSLTRSLTRSSCRALPWRQEPAPFQQRPVSLRTVLVPWQQAQHSRLKPIQAPPVQPLAFPMQH